MKEDKKELVSDKLKRLGVREEKWHSEWFYRYKFSNQLAIVHRDKDKETSASKFFVKYLKSLHYSIRELFENKQTDELKTFVEKMKDFKEPNIDKTIEILERSGVKY